MIGAGNQHFALFLERVHAFGYPARQRGALFDHQLSGGGIFGHDLQRLAAVTGFRGHHLDAHELETKGLCLGFDHFGQAFQIGHSFSTYAPHATMGFRAGPLRRQPLQCRDNVGMSSQISGSRLKSKREDVPVQLSSASACFLLQCRSWS